MTSSEAENVLRDVLPVFRDSWKAGWEDVRTTFNNPDWDNRTRSMVLHMQAVIQAKQRFAALPHVQYHEHQAKHLFYWPNVALFRMKILDEHLRMSNFRTRSAEALGRQEEIPGFGLVPILTIGLVPDTHWLKITGIYLISPRNLDQNNWELDITDDAQERHPSLPIDLPTAPKTKRFKPKHGTTDDSQSAAG